MEMQDNKIAVLTGDPLPVGRRFYEDEGVLTKLGGQTVTYYVRAISGDSRENSAAARKQVVLPAIKPETPTSLSVSPIVRDGKSFVDVSVDYDATTAVDDFVVYRLTSDTHQWVEFASIDAGDMKERVQLKQSFPGKTAFRVVAVNHDAPESDPTKEVYVELPAVAAPAPASRFLVIPHADRVEFKWWASTSDFVRGARIIANDKVIADETQLNADDRSWVWHDPGSGDHEYEIVFVDGFGRESTPKVGLVTGRVKQASDDAELEPGADVKIVDQITKNSYYDENKKNVWIVTQYAVAEDGQEFKHGLTTNYDKEGNKVREINTQYGKAHGVTRFFNPDGSIQRIVCMLYGRVVTSEEMIDVLGDQSLTPEDKQWLSGQ